MQFKHFQAYHGDAELKDKHDAWIAADIAADNLIYGTYGDESESGWRGCQWGCYLRSRWPHAEVEQTLGLPMQLSILADACFEGLSAEISPEAGRAFAQTFFSTLVVGADYARVFPRYAAWLMAEIQPHVEDADVKSVLTRAEALFTQMAATSEIPDDEFDAVRSAARAARAARAALDALAARAARDARDALDASWQRMAEKLIELVKEESHVAAQIQA